jgi:Tfp pilus assembly protein PilX
VTKHKVTGNHRERARAGMRHVQAGRYRGVATIDPSLAFTAAVAALSSAKSAVAHKTKYQEKPSV